MKQKQKQGEKSGEDVKILQNVGGNGRFFINLFCPNKLASLLFTSNVGIVAARKG